MGWSIMRKLKRATSAAVVVAALAGISAITAATPAATPAAADYKCTTSTKSVDDPSYSGPWADNWDFTVKACA